MMLIAQTAQHSSPLVRSLPDWAVVLFGLLGVAIWVGTHVALSRRGGRRRLLFPLRTLVGFGATWLALNALACGLVLATDWPLWIPALIAAIAVETILALYALERRVVSRKGGATLAGLRLALAFLVILMLVQPKYSHDWVEVFERYLAVLIDRSASMRQVDEDLTGSEKLRLAHFFSSDETVKSPHRFNLAEQQMLALAERLADRADGLERLRGFDFQALCRQLDARREKIKTMLLSAKAGADEQITVIDLVLGGQTKLEPSTIKALDDLKTAIAQRVQAPLTAAAQRIEAAAAEEQLGKDYTLLLEDMRVSQRALTELAAMLPPLAVELENSYFAALTAEQQESIERDVRRTREDIASAVLFRPARGEPSLTSRIEEKYIPRFYAFATDATERSAPSEWAADDGATTEPAAVDPAAESPATLLTDYAAALKKVQADISPGQLAGVLILSDGRPNGKESYEAVARELRDQQVPLCTALIGSPRAPADAAVLADTGAPKTVYVGDTFTVRADLKLDGLNGKEAHVTLTHAGRVIDEETVAITDDHLRTSVDLTDTRTETGVFPYEVRVEPFDEERWKANNTKTVHVAVSDDRTKLLLIDDRPRWEFRYIRNLFAGGDKTVQLQYVLIHPDRIADAPEREKTYASVTRPVDEFEATDLPENEEEWLKFDVIILGDVALADLGDENIKIIEKFVSERGGSLVVVAGPNHLPDDYTASSLQDLFPMTFAPPKPEEEAATDPTKGFRIALSEAGLDHVVMQQSTLPQETLRIWESIPEIYWRHPVIDTKPGAVVLSYAMPEERPDVFKFRTAATSPTPEETERRQKARREYERKNALIAVQRYGAGRVMMFSFDGTWRLRYRVGDTHHHRFWGQVMRWATADKLPVGTPLVRLGTDKMLYHPGEPVVVRAKITDEKHAAVKTETAFAKVYDGDRLVLQKKLDYVAESAGMYRTDLDPLEPGKTYRVELDCAEADALLALHDQTRLSTSLTVADAPTAEFDDLSADRAALDRLAHPTGGIVTTVAGAGRVLERYGAGVERITRHREFQIWDSWPLLILMVAVATGEWILRKRMGLT